MTQARHAPCPRSWQVALLVALALALVWAGPVPAAARDAEVERLQLPAWLVRDGKRGPLAPGTALRAGDRVETGPGARALLRLADGSMVKLGENARFTIDDVSHGARNGNALFTAALSVVEGAFRFTTSLLTPFRGSREVTVRFATATVGIRGTDVWGKSAADRDIVVLIEGKIRITRAGEAPVDLSQARTLYQAPRGGLALPISAIDAERLGLYAAETEIVEGSGAVERSGRWRVYAAQTAARNQAVAVLERVRAAGFPAVLSVVDVPGQAPYRVVITGLATERDGIALAARLNSELELERVSVAPD